MNESPEIDIYDLYGTAAEMPNDALREAFIQAHCAHDPPLLDRLRSMLAVREDADTLFEHAAEFHAADSGVTPFSGLGRVGRFRLEKLVGRGGMGNVFLAFDEQLQRPVALKFPRLDTMSNPKLLELFLREAQLAAQLKHPNLVEIYEVGVWGQACFIASEWCAGGDLASHLAKHPGPQDPRWSASLLRSVAQAVAYCHREGVVHLDIKPGNIILATQGEHGSLRDKDALHPMLTDFGVARVIEEGQAATQTSTMLGTPLYMAPEQATCERQLIGPASDQFALGVVLFELLYGVRPFEGESAIEVIDKIRNSDSLALPEGKGIPRDLQIICARALQHKPVERYASVTALADDLNRFLTDEPIQARPISRFRRRLRWFERPERMVQAGAVATVIQLLVLVSFFVSSLAVIVDYGNLFGISRSVHFTELIVITVFLHIPTLFLAIMAIQRRQWSILPGFLLSLFAAGLIGSVVVTGESPLTIYKDNLLATFLMHSMLANVMLIQTIAYLVALPAAFRRGK